MSVIYLNAGQSVLFSGTQNMVTLHKLNNQTSKYIFAFLCDIFQSCFFIFHYCCSLTTSTLQTIVPFDQHDAAQLKTGVASPNAHL